MSLLTARRRLPAVILAPVLIFASACGGSGEEKQPGQSTEIKPVTVKVAQATENLSFIAVYAARANGFFEQEKVNADFTLFGSSGPDVQALIAGDVDVALTSGTTYMSANSATNGKVVGFYNLLDNLNVQLVTKKETLGALGVSTNSPLKDKVAALKGRSVGVSRPGSVSYAVAADLLKSGGLKPGENVELVGLGSAAAISAAIKQGQVDAGILAPPFTESSVNEGWGEVLIDPRENVDEFLYQVAVTTKDKAGKNADALTRFSKALRKGSEWVVKTPANEVADKLAVYFRDLDRAVLTTAVERIQGIVSPTGVITKPGFENALKLANALDEVKGSVTFESAATDAFLK